MRIPLTTMMMMMMMMMMMKLFWRITPECMPWILPDIDIMSDTAVRKPFPVVLLEVRSDINNVNNRLQISLESLTNSRHILTNRKYTPNSHIMRRIKRPFLTFASSYLKADMSSFLERFRELFQDTVLDGTGGDEK